MVATAAQEKPRSDCPGQVSFTLGQVKMEDQWSSEKVKLASVVLLVIISSQKQLQNFRLQDEQNNELKAWILLNSLNYCLWK